MDKDANSGGDFYAFVAWADAHRKQLIWTLAAVVAVGAVVGLYFTYKNSHEDRANAALFALDMPIPGHDPATTAQAAQFAQVADEYPDTSAGARAMLLAGRIYFEANEFDQAKMMFQRVLAEHPTFPLANIAAVGVAASLEAEGKLPEATARYEDIVRRATQDSTWPQAQAALARLYTKQNQPERAFEAFKQLLSAGSSDSWTMEAQLQVRELLDKYPQLRQRPAQTAAPAASPIPETAPVLNLPKP